MAIRAKLLGRLEELERKATPPEPVEIIFEPLPNESDFDSRDAWVTECQRLRDQSPIVFLVDEPKAEVRVTRGK